MAVYWYGERGIINALVTQIQACEEPVAVAISFLRCIQWAADDLNLDWLDRVSQVDFVVELGLHRFGDPDLIVVCTTKDNEGTEQRHAFFIEAKITSYQTSVETGGGSGINRQLTLKYRFARAVVDWNGNDNIPIIESHEQHAAYRAIDLRNHPSILETLDSPRNIAKRSVLQILANCGLAAVPFDNMYFVAWTWDSGPFFANNFFNSPTRLMFLSEDGEELLKDENNAIRNRLGWLGFQNIAVGLRDIFGPPYQQAVSTMIPNNQLTPVAEGNNNNAPELFSEPVRNFDEAVQQQWENLKLAAIQVFGARDAKESAALASFSVTLYCTGLGKRKVLIKLLPSKNENDEQLIVLGVSTSLGKNQWGGQQSQTIRRIGAGRNRQPFYIFDLGRDEAGINFAMSVFDEVQSLLISEENENV